jgi:hypothetical protein
MYCLHPCASPVSNVATVLVSQTSPAVVTHCYPFRSPAAWLLAAGCLAGWAAAAPLACTCSAPDRQQPPVPATGLVMEVAPDGDAMEYIAQRGGLPEDEARWFFQQLVLGMDFLQAKGTALTYSGGSTSHPEVLPHILSVGSVGNHCGVVDASISKPYQGQAHQPGQPHSSTALQCQADPPPTLLNDTRCSHASSSTCPAMVATDH